MGAPVVDDKMDINEETVGVEKEEEAEEIEPSKLLINNVSLIKKSVESKGEPRFIANVFRQVRSISRSRHTIIIKIIIVVVVVVVVVFF